MEILYKKVSITDKKEIPNENEDYFVFFKYNNKELITTCYWDLGEFHNYDESSINVTHWLKEMSLEDYLKEKGIIHQTFKN